MIEIDYATRSMVIKDAANSVVINDVQLDFGFVAALDESVKAAERARYLDKPSVSELEREGVAIDVAIERCIEQERLFQ